MNVKILRQLIKNLQNKVRCPNCKAKFNKASQIEFRGYLDNTYFLQLKCNHCPTVVFATVVVAKEKDFEKENEREKVEEQTVNAIEKINRFHTERAGKSAKGKKKISYDDIIDFHEMIERFDGDFTAYFGKENS